MNFLRSVLARLGLDWTAPPKDRETWEAFLKEIESAELTPIPREELEILKDRALLFTTLLERAPDVILQLDRLGVCREVNPVIERLLGYTQADVIDKHFTTLPFLTPQAVQAGLVEFAANLTGKERPPFEITLVHRNGERVVLEANARRMTREGRFVGIMVIFRNVTERKRIEAELAQTRDIAVESARVKSEFLANMSHEIRTPMNAIIGMTDLLLETGLRKDQREYVETVQHSADALLQIINDVLDLSKMEAGRMEFRKEDFDLRDLLEEAAQMVAARAQGKGLELVSLVPADMPTAFIGDRLRLQQIVVNLLSNAVKFTERGEVVVRASLEGHIGEAATVLIEVSDTGIGISDRDQGKLFQSFSQVESSASRRYGGTGLGLVISKKLVEGMSGTIGFRSEPGRGSTFYFRVPLPQGTMPPAVEIDGTLEGVRVLIVDDNPVNRFLLHSQLSSWGIDDEAVESGHRALERLKAARKEGKPFQLILLDVAMPGMDGMETARQINSDKKRDARIIIMSSIGQPFAPEALADAGIASQLTKPVKQSRLYDCLVTVLNQGRRPGRAKKSASARAPQERRPHLRVLVVDDNEVNQRLTVLQLEKLGLEANAVGTGREAIDAWKEETYSLVFMDCQMPQMDGFEATIEIRRREKGRQRTPIVGLTANSMAGDRERCLAAGMDDYLSKPVRLEQLATMVRKWDIPVDTMRAASVRENVGAHNYPELVRIFLRTSRENIRTIREALEKGDRAAIGDAAHTLKGSSSNMGARAVQILCARLQDEAGTAADLRPLVEDLEAALARAHALFTAELPADRPGAPL